MTNIWKAFVSVPVSRSKLELETFETRSIFSIVNRGTFIYLLQLQRLGL